MRSLAAKHLVSIFLILLTGQVAFGKDDSHFRSGRLDLHHEGENIGVAGIVVDIQRSKQGDYLYKLEVNHEDIDAVWVMAGDKLKRQGFKIEEGEKVIFKGKITDVKDIDDSGSLRRRIKSNSILVAHFAETAETRRQKSEVKREGYFPEIPEESLDL
jgi:hypothetical protein